MLGEIGWDVVVEWYEPASAHKWLVGYEVYWPFKLASYGLMRLVGPWWVRHVTLAGAGEPLRVLLRAERKAHAKEGLYSAQ